MEGRRAAGALLALAACFAYAAAAPTLNDQSALELYGGDAAEGCYYNFQHYGEGDRIMTNEPCLNCTCHNRMLMCYLRVCPFTKPIGHDCTIEKRADQCCPIITCPDVPVDLLTSTSTTSPAEYGATGVGHVDKYGCSINERYYAEGSKVPSTPNKPCEHCYCIRNMTTCVMQECTLHVDGCTPIYHKDVCCPVRYSCDHPEDEILRLDDMTTTVRPTPGFLLTTTVSSVTQDCVHDDQIFADGALIKTEKACEHCYCMKGDIVCVVQECGTPMENEGKNCTSLAPREGQCCPDTYICEGDNDVPSEHSTTLEPPRQDSIEGSGYTKDTEHVPLDEFEGSGLGDDKMTEPSVDIHDTTLDEQHPSRATTPTIIIDETEADEQFQSTTLDDKHKPHGSTFIPPSEDTTPTLEPDKGENTVPHGLPEEETAATAEIKKEEITTIESVVTQELTTSKAKIEETASEPIREQTTESIIDSSISQDVDIATTEISIGKKTEDQSDHEPESKRTTSPSKFETTASPEVVTDTMSSEPPELTLSTSSEDQTSESIIYPVTEVGDNVEVSTERDIHVDITTIKELFITTEKVKVITDKLEPPTISAEDVTTESRMEVSTKTTEEFFDKDVSQTTTENIHILKETTPVSHEEDSMFTTTEISDTLSTTVANLAENEIGEDEHIPPITSPGIIPGEGACLVDGVTYSNESIVPTSHKCQASCRCMSSIVKCDTIQCTPPPENMINCQPEYDSEESCCPTYTCDHSKETIPPQPHSQMSGTELPPSETEDCGENCVKRIETTKPECTGSQCEVDEIKPVKVPELCSSDNCGISKDEDKTPSTPDQSICTEDGCVSTPQCVGDNCEVLPPVSQPTETSKLPIDTEKDIPSGCEGDQCISRPIECTGTSCETPEQPIPPTDKLCDEEHGCTPVSEQHIPSTSCTGDTCEPAVQQPQVPCRGDDECKGFDQPSIPIVSCEGDLCVTPQPAIPVTVPSTDCDNGDCTPSLNIKPDTVVRKDDACSEEHGCKKPISEEIPVTQCTDETCVQEAIPDQQCDGKDCRLPDTVISEKDTPVIESSTSDITDEKISTTSPLFTVSGDISSPSKDIITTEQSKPEAVTETGTTESFVPDTESSTEYATEKSDTSITDIEYSTKIIETETERSSDITDISVTAVNELTKSPDKVVPESDKPTEKPDSGVRETTIFSEILDTSSLSAEKSTETVTAVSAIKKSTEIVITPDVIIEMSTEKIDISLPEIEKSTEITDTTSAEIEISTEKDALSIPDISVSTEIIDTSDMEKSTKKTETSVPDHEKTTEMVVTAIPEIEISTEKDTSTKEEATVADVPITTEIADVFVPEIEKSTEIGDNFVTDIDKSTKTPASTDASIDKEHYSTTLGSSPDIEVVTERQTSSDLEKTTDASPISDLERFTVSPKTSAPEIEKSTETVVDDGVVTDKYAVTEASPTPEIEKTTEIIESSVFDIDKSTEAQQPFTPDLEKSSEIPDTSVPVQETTTETVESSVTELIKSTEKTDISEPEITLSTVSTSLPEIVKATDKPDFVGPESEPTTETTDVSKTEVEIQTELPEIVSSTEKSESLAPDVEIETLTGLPEITVKDTERTTEMTDLTSPELHKSTEKTDTSEFTVSSVSEVEKSTDKPKSTSHPQIDDTAISDLDKTTVTSDIEKSTEITDTSLPDTEKSTEIVFDETTTHKTSQEPTDTLEIVTEIPHDVTIIQDHVSITPEETSTESVSDVTSSKSDTDKLTTELKPDAEYTRIPEKEITETSVQATSELPVSVKQETSSVISLETEPFTETTQSDYIETKTSVPTKDQEEVSLSTEPPEKSEPTTHYAVEITEDSKKQPETTTVYLVELEEHTHKSQEDITTTVTETYSSIDREDAAVSMEPHKEDDLTASHAATTEKEREFTSQPTEVSSIFEVSEDITKSTDLKQDELTTFEPYTTKSIPDEQVIDESTDIKLTTLGIELENTRRTTSTLTVLDSKKETIEDEDVFVTPATEISATDSSAKDRDESSEKISTTVTTIADQKHMDETLPPQKIDEEQPDRSTHPYDVSIKPDSSTNKEPESSEHVTEGIIQTSPTDGLSYTTIPKVEGKISTVSAFPVGSVDNTEPSIQESTTTVEKITISPTEQEVSTTPYESFSISSEPSVESHYTTARIFVDVEDQTKHADSTDMDVESTPGLAIFEDKSTTPDLIYHSETTVSATSETSKIPVIDDLVVTEQIPDFTEKVEKETEPSVTIENITQEAITSESIPLKDITVTTPSYPIEDTVLPEKLKPDTTTEISIQATDETTKAKIEEPKLTTISDTTVSPSEIDLYTTHKIDLTTNIQDETSKKTEDKETEITTFKVPEEITLKSTDDIYDSTLMPETEVPTVKDDTITEKIPALVTEEQYPETTHKDEVEVEVTELTESPTKLAQPSASSTAALEHDVTEIIATTLADKTIGESDQTTTVQSILDVTKENVEPSEQFSNITTEATVTEQVLHASTDIPITEQEKTEEKPTSSTISEGVSKPTTEDKLPSSTPSDVPSPDEDSEHQMQEQFPPSGGGYSPEQDYGEDDQAFGPGTCRYGGKVYVSAQQIPRDDPCDFCFCFRSDIICLQQSCPPPIHGCHEEPIQGFCCPRYECPVSMATTLNVTTTTTTTTTTLPPHFLPHAYKGAAQRRGCQIKGHSYQVGEVVKSSSGPCLHCTCGGDGQMKCDPKACTPEPMLRQMIAAAVSSKRRR